MERELVRRGDRPGPGIRPEPRFRAARDVRRVGGYRTLGFPVRDAGRLGSARRIRQTARRLLAGLAGLGLGCVGPLPGDLQVFALAKPLDV